MPVNPKALFAQLAKLKKENYVQNITGSDYEHCAVYAICKKYE